MTTLDLLKCEPYFFKDIYNGFYISYGEYISYDLHHSINSNRLYSWVLITRKGVTTKYNDKEDL